VSGLALTHTCSLTMRRRRLIHCRRSLVIPTALASIITFSLIPSFAIPPQQPAAQQPADESQASPKARERLRRLREQPGNKTYMVGYSPALERELAELNGIEVPRNETQNAKRIRAEARRRLAAHEQELRRREKENPGLQYQSRAVLNEIKARIQRAHPGQQLLSTPSIGIIMPSSRKCRIKESAIVVGPSPPSRLLKAIRKFSRANG
jgi:predicted ATP-dependent protease